MPKFSKEEDLLRAIFGEPSGTIGDNLPCGYHDGRLGERNPELDALLGEKVVGESYVSMDEDLSENSKCYPEPWPGPEKWVYKWWTLKNGKMVAWIRGVTIIQDEFIVR
jgi:hypothetical protein